MYRGGIQDDKFALLYNVNTYIKVAVKTPVGKTQRGVITNAIIQGDVFGPMLCGKQVDEIGKECLQEDKYVYKYKGEVDIPPLAMLDDLITISECGHKTAMVNSYVRCKTLSKKLQFGPTKCKKMHVGKYKEEFKCQPLFVDNWKETEDCDTENIKVKDTCDGDEVMEEKNSERYLGDVISKDGKNIKNIQARVNKGTGIVRNILTMLDGIPFGKYHFEAGVILRNTLLASSMLFNSEVWYNVTNSELELLETVDLLLLRGILKAPKSTPKEMLFLELGVVPFREMIRRRRLGFLHYILTEDKNSMIFKFFESQRKNRSSKDWVTTVLEDMKKLNLNLSFEEIGSMKKYMFLRIIKRKTEHEAMKYLEKLKEKHSKVKLLKHPVLKMQKYLMPNDINMKNEDGQNIFRLRSKMTAVKMNQRNRYENHECEVCGIFDESQEHVLNCKEILEMNEESDISEIPEYNRIFDGTVMEQVKISKIFSKNMKVIENIRRNNNK